MKPIRRETRPLRASGPVLALEAFLPFRLSVLSNRATRAVGRVVRGQGVSAPEWRTMAVLGRYGATTANDVVERTAMDKVRVSRAVAHLMRKGFITRHADPEDRRRAILELTSAGSVAYHRMVPEVLAVEADLMADLDREDRVQLDSVLAKLEQRMPLLPAAEVDD